MKSLKNKVALITGGAQGLGKEICEELAKTGVIVIGADIQKEKIEILVNEFKNKKIKIEAVKLDVTEEADVKKIIETIKKRFKNLDILINNAAIDFSKPIEELTVNEWDKEMNVNLRGPFLLSKYALEMMKKAKFGHIINIVSTAAVRAWPNAVAYHTSKWGLLGMSYALFTEARKYNVKVTALIAGGMRTPFILERFPDVPLTNLQDPKNVAETIKFILMQPAETIIPSVMVLPLQETSWP